MALGELTDFDKALLNLLQGHLPVCRRPFAELAKKLGSDEDTVLGRLRELKEHGYLRRIGTFFDSGRLGYGGTLVALLVEPEYLEQVATAINRYPGATHNYEREGKYNLWFTLLTPDASKEKAILAEVRALPGVKELVNLTAKKKYKINVKFSLK